MYSTVMIILLSSNGLSDIRNNSNRISESLLQLNRNPPPTALVTFMKSIVLRNTVVGKTKAYGLLRGKGPHSISSKPKFPVPLLKHKNIVRILDMSIKVCHKICKLIHHVESASHSSEY
jgi:hypothetical protein